jgi:hypothetical protein
MTAIHVPAGPDGKSHMKELKFEMSPVSTAWASTCSRSYKP